GFTVNINGAGPQAVSYVSDGTAISSEIVAGLQASFAAAVTASGSTSSDIALTQVGATDVLKISALTTDTDFVVSANAAASNTAARGVAASVNQNGALVSTTGSDPARASLQSDFNGVIAQIDALSKDTSYNGINLLHGDNLKVVFNEHGTSNLTITGVTFDSAG